MANGDVIILAVIIFLVVAFIYEGIHIIRSDRDGITAENSFIMWSKLNLNAQVAAKLEENYAFDSVVSDVMERKKVRERDSAAIGMFISAAGMILFMSYLVWESELLMLLGLTCCFLCVPLGWCVSYALHFIRWLRKKKDAI